MGEGRRPRHRSPSGFRRRRRCAPGTHGLQRGPLSRNAGASARRAASSGGAGPAAAGRLPGPEPAGGGALLGQGGGRRPSDPLTLPLPGRLRHRSPAAHRRDDRHPQGGDAHAHQSAGQRQPGHRLGTDAARGRGELPVPAALLPRLRADLQPLLRGAEGRHPGDAAQVLGGSGARRARAAPLHLLRRRAGHVRADPRRRPEAGHEPGHPALRRVRGGPDAAGGRGPVGEGDRRLLRRGLRHD